MNQKSISHIKQQPRRKSVKPFKLGTMFPYIEATITSNGEVLHRCFDAPVPIAKGLKALIAAGRKPESLTINRGYYPGWKRDPSFTAATAKGQELLNWSC